MRNKGLNDNGFVITYRTKLFYNYINNSNYSVNDYPTAYREIMNKKMITCALERLYEAGVDVNEFIEESLFSVKAAERYTTLMNCLKNHTVRVGDIQYLISVDDFIHGLKEARPQVAHMFTNDKSIFQLTDVNVEKRFHYAMNIASFVEIGKNLNNKSMFAKYISYANHGKDYAGGATEVYYNRKTIKLLDKLEKHGLPLEKYITATMEGHSYKERFENLSEFICTKYLDEEDLRYVVPYKDFLRGCDEKYPELNIMGDGKEDINDLPESRVDELFHEIYEPIEQKIIDEVAREILGDDYGEIDLKDIF